MKNRYLTILSGVVILSLLAIGGASAFTVNSVDGIWGNIDGVATTSEEYPVDIIGYADNGTLAPLKQDQHYILNSDICSGKQNIDPVWPDTSRWTSSGLTTYTNFGSHTSSCTSASDLFFSEYLYESRRGWFIDQPDYVIIEIANYTGGSVDLGDYDVHLYTGNTTYTEVNLSGTLATNDVYVITTSTNPISNEHYTFNDNEGYRTVVLVKDTGTATEGATCDRWSTGPSGSPVVYSDWDPGIQSPPTTDENRVVYGRDSYGTGYYACELTNFSEQSGFGFDGRDESIQPATLDPFFLGSFFHYNRPVVADSNSFEYVDLTVTVPVVCNDGSAADPPNFTIVPRFNLDETTNSGTCAYGEPGDEPCPDRVTIEFPTMENPTFVCPEGTYTVNILGFTETGQGTDACWESYNDSAVSTEYITQEYEINEACLWARIEQPLADISVAKTCWAFDSQDPYYVITTSNLGPGFARSVTLTDTLPDGVVFESYTSQLTTTSGTINQGTCNVNGQLVECSLGTPLLDYSTDPEAKWVVRINVGFGTGNNIVNTVTVDSITADPYEGNNTDTAECNPNAACMISFDALRAEDGIVLSWETASEVDNLGFNIYRAENPEGEKVRINPTMIPSQNIGSTSGAFYEYLDEDVEIGNTYYYWLETVDFALTTTIYGPITAEY